jgi:hypothetical protein
MKVTPAQTFTQSIDNLSHAAPQRNLTHPLHGS